MSVHHFQTQPTALEAMKNIILFILKFPASKRKASFWTFASGHNATLCQRNMAQPSRVRVDFTIPRCPGEHPKVLDQKTYALP